MHKLKHDFGVAASQVNVVVACQDIRPEFERKIGLLDAEPKGEPGPGPGPGPRETRREKSSS